MKPNRFKKDGKGGKNCIAHDKNVEKIKGKRTTSTPCGRSRSEADELKAKRYPKATVVLGKYDTGRYRTAPAAVRTRVHCSARNCRSETAANNLPRIYNAPRPFLLLPRLRILRRCDAFVTNFTQRRSFRE
ncbi:hypothetical protein EVAR_96294_1 [Eumeta japonica]|uniref:Uncharacterized protein n=1 Tax=Eumeta variegata TaxID=151549 RepID=A0A4C1VUZ9_EUMVA|nr:hypothetical protein EVAR_96294_1 [Eumeta japonica]